MGTQPPTFICICVCECSTGQSSVYQPLFVRLLLLQHDETFRCYCARVGGGCSCTGWRRQDTGGGSSSPRSTCSPRSTSSPRSPSSTRSPSSLVLEVDVFIGRNPCRNPS